MPEQQRTLFFVSDDPEPVLPNNPLWDMALPLGRHQPSCPGVTRANETLTYGGYFGAVSAFLKAHQSDFIVKAASHIAGRTVHPQEISHIHIHLEKHGAFYHPARIVLPLTDVRISLVANLAVSEVGKKTIENEYRQLKRLAGRYSRAWVPEVFGYGSVQIDGPGYAQMFMGEWFEGFHEFHVSDRNGPDPTGIRVWDPVNRNLFLSRHQAQSVFEQAAMILTAYYNVETFEQIDSWHHAAGDFVVCLNEDEPRLKLVTVRGYKPLFHLKEDDGSLETILNTLLIFFLRLSIRLRIDRRDGVFDVAWIDLDIVKNICNGFLKGLALQVENSRIPQALIDAFKAFFLHLPEKDIRDICMGIVNQSDPKSPDFRVIKRHLDDHVEAVLSARHQMKSLT